MRKITGFLAIGIVGLLIISSFVGLMSSANVGQPVIKTIENCGGV